jgi:Clp amino terminal domain, pathogenicity island component
MFERYTEKARRVIFFARYEASSYGSQEIDTEHLLLGLLREAKNILSSTPTLTANEVRKRIDARSFHQAPIPTNIDLPLSPSAQSALKFAADSADHLAQRHIGTEHIFLGILHVRDCFASQLLHEAGADEAKIQEQLALQPSEQGPSLQSKIEYRRLHGAGPIGPVEIHGIKRKTEHIRDMVSMLRMYNWHWRREKWKPQDIVVDRKTGQISFDIALQDDTENFALVANGWKKDHCFLCRWELSESDDEHGAGYTNGRIWLCIECCERFILRDYFGSSHSEMT